MNQERIKQYHNDPIFHVLVDTIADGILRKKFSQKDVEDALEIAVIKVKQREEERRLRENEPKEKA